MNLSCQLSKMVNPFIILHNGFNGESSKLLYAVNLNADILYLIE